jgi:small subunit ribosomal protein S21
MGGLFSTFALRSLERAATRRGRGEYQVSTEVKVRKGETIEKALRRLKKKLDREGVMREVRARRHYEKPSEQKRRKAARARSRTV